MKAQNRWLQQPSPDGDAKGAESAGSASLVKSKELEVSGGSMSDSYAMVALVDKKQYRAEADMMKKDRENQNITWQA